MNASTIALKIPEHTPVLVDTNVLIDSIEFGISMAPLYKALGDIHTDLVLSEIVHIEFLRGFDDVVKPQVFLDGIFGESPFLLPFDSDVRKNSHLIDRIYRKQGNKKVSMGDLLIASQMARYSLPKRTKNIITLATQNHKDFPAVLFDLVDVVNIRVPNGAIKTIGFYQFNTERFGNVSK